MPPGFIRFLQQQNKLVRLVFFILVYNTVHLQHIKFTEVHSVHSAVLFAVLLCVIMC